MNTLQTGTQLKNGEYRIIRVLGQDDFGITYQAEQVTRECTVAVKEFFMTDNCFRDANTRQVSVPSTGSRDLVERFRNKFLHEARRIARLDHPNIVKFFDVFEENGTAYSVMEFIGGGSLAEKVKTDGAMQESTALDYIRQVADALSYLHKRNLLHFDVQPSHILLDDAGQAKLIDFGTSKHHDEADRQTSSTQVSRSQGYAPLEQKEPKTVSSFSPATDIYALGATFYTLLTGKRPPDASAVSSNGIPALPDSISETTKNAIKKAMEPRRTERPQSIEAFLACLEKTASPYAGPQKKETKKLEEETDETGTIVGALVIVCLIFMGIFLLRTSQYDTSENIPPAAATPDSITSPAAATPDQSTLPAAATPDQSTLPAAATPDSNGHLTVKVPNTPVQFDMVMVKAGSFTMGATREQDKDTNLDEFPTHQVTLTKDFYMGKYEVTQELYEAVMGTNPSHFKGPNRPVEEVSWDDVQAFCFKLSDLTGKTFRLPTEAEWEYAARGGHLASQQQTKYAGSNSIGKVAWYYRIGGTHPVGRKSPNALGLYDMSGNVWEWCSDWYGDYSKAAQTDPAGPSWGSRHIFRGGGWFSDAQCRVSARSLGEPYYHYFNLGFRLVCDPQ